MCKFMRPAWERKKSLGVCGFESINPPTNSTAVHLRRSSSLNISEFTSCEDHSGSLITGELHINLHNSLNLSAPLPREKVSACVKAMSREGVTCAAAYPEGEGWQVSTGISLLWCAKTSLTVLPTNFQVFSINGVSFPVGRKFNPSWYGHTLVYYPDYGKVRALSCVEAWSLQGGSLETFPNASGNYRELALLTSTSVAMQLYLTGLALGRWAIFPSETTRTGGLDNPLSYLLHSDQTAMPATGRMSRTQTISRHMSRMLRHGANPREHRLDLDLADGGSVLISTLLRHPTYARLHVAQSEIMEICKEQDSSHKLRFDVEATRGGPKVRCFQYHTLPAVRTSDRGAKDRNRYLIQSTDVISATAILRGGMKQTRHRTESHFVELQYDGRQAGYITSASRGGASPKIWLVLGTDPAASLGYAFTKLPNVEVASDGNSTEINRSVFVSAWVSDTQRVSIQELLNPDHDIVIIDHDNERPHPKRMENLRRATSPQVNQRTASPASPPIPTVSVSDYHPPSPTPSQLDLPESERPASWSPAENHPTKRMKLPPSPSTSPSLSASSPPALSSTTSALFTS